MTDEALSQNSTASADIQALKSRLLTGGSWAISGKLLALIMSVALNALLARLLSPDELGTYFLATSVVMLGARVGTLGLNQAVVRLVSESLATNRSGRARNAVLMTLGFGALGALVIGGSYRFVGSLLGTHVFHSPALASVSGLLAGWIIALVLLILLSESFRGFHDVRLATTFQGTSGPIATALITTLLSLLLFAGASISLSTVLVIVTGSSFATVVLAGWILHRKIKPLPTSGSQLDELPLGELAHIAWPLLVSNVAMYLLSQTDLWVVSIFLAEEEIAVYGAALRIVALVTLPSLISNMVIPPLISQLFAKQRLQLLESLLRLASTIQSGLALGAFVIFVLGGEEIIEVIYGEYYRQSATLLIVLTLGQLINCCGGSCAMALIMTGHGMDLMKVSIFAGALLVVGSTLAIPLYGTMGVAGCTVVSIAVQNVLAVLIVKKRIGIWTHVGFNLRHLTRIGV